MARYLRLVNRKREDGGVVAASCSECGARAGLHALSCSHYRAPAVAVARLTAAEISELRSLTPSMWEAWPPDDYDQGLPVVEVRQDHLHALLDELDELRHQLPEP